MKKLFITIILLSAICSSFAQTIVWKQLASLPEGYNGGEAVSLNNEIYYVAGRTKTTKNSFFYKLNPKENQWIKLADIPEPATNLALAAVKGKIYAIGGDLFKDTNREYNPQTNSWRILEPMPTARQHIDCGIFDDNIFIIGGLTSWTTISKRNEVYNITTNSWSEKEAVPTLRNCAAIATMDSLTYVIGGGGSKTSVWEETASIECYNIKSNTWKRKADLPYKLYKPAAIVVNNELMVLGGSTTTGKNTVTLDKVLIYNSKSDEWIETTPLPSKNIFFGCTSIGNKIYLIGGTAGSESDWINYPVVYEGTMIINESTK
jgi:N-acetylneuraminic acid mutarotase